MSEIKRPAKRSVREIGSGAGIIILFLVGLGVAWFVIDFVIGWVYSTKEERVAESHRRVKKGNGKRGFDLVTVTTTTIPKELGSYTVEYDK